MNIAHYQAKQYGRQPCWELVADVYAHEMAPIMVEYVPAKRSEREMADAFRIAIHSQPHGFHRVEKPVDMAIVLLGRNECIGVHHCGIWFAGKILHAEPGATLYEERTAVATRYRVMEFWIHADPPV